MRPLPTLLLSLCLSAAPAAAQAIYAANGPGSYIALGATASSYNSAYGQQQLGGATVFLDTNLYRRIGLEAEARFLNFHSSDTSHQETYLVGPKISSHGRRIRPYGKLLAGRGEFTFPFHYAQGSYFVAAPGAGLDWRIQGYDGPTRFMVRIIDVEYQIWPDFTFGPMHPYGISTGLSFRLF